MNARDDRTLGVLMQALAVCRGLLHSARFGDLTIEEIDGVLSSTGGESLCALIGRDAYHDVLRAWEQLPAETRDILLAIRGEPG